MAVLIPVCFAAVAVGLAVRSRSKLPSVAALVLIAIAAASIGFLATRNWPWHEARPVLWLLSLLGGAVLLAAAALVVAARIRRPDAGLRRCSALLVAASGVAYFATLFVVAVNPWA
jgi:hypothetical protein